MPKMLIKGKKRPMQAQNGLKHAQNLSLMHRFPNLSAQAWFRAVYSLFTAVLQVKIVHIMLKVLRLLLISISMPIMISKNPSEHPMQTGGNTSHHQKSSTLIDYQFRLHLLWEMVKDFLLEEESPMAGVDRLLAIVIKDIPLSITPSSAKGNSIGHPLLPPSPMHSPLTRHACPS